MKIRSELEKIDGIRKTFVGTFDRFGQKQGRYKGATVLLLKVYHATRLPEQQSYTVSDFMVTDHLWFNLTKQFAALNLVKGDIVLFDARVKEYRKGSVKRDIPVAFDYKLSHPYKLQKFPAA